MYSLSWVKKSTRHQRLPVINYGYGTGTMGIPSAIISGTVGYIVLLCVALVVLQSSRATGMLSKDNTEIGNVVVTIATFSMWLFWLCAWMHQWHPLIQPIYEG
jgi:V-type H+-transporting ATPase subunit e